MGKVRFIVMIALPARLLASIFLAGCAAAPQVQEKIVGTGAGLQLTSFSAGIPGALPAGWEPLVLLRHKPQTRYQLVSKESRTVLHASAAKASSALMLQTQIDPYLKPWLQWEWKIGGVVKDADNTVRAKEDSPVRIILGFDGDKENLPFSDQILIETARTLTGHELPYATLMYIWENKAAPGTIITSAHTGRVRMIVASQGAVGAGKWHTITRNIIEDFEKAYGEKPGKLIAVGVLTDTDNTGDTVEAWYGDIHLLERYE